MVRAIARFFAVCLTLRPVKVDVCPKGELWSHHEGVMREHDVPIPTITPSTRHGPLLLDSMVRSFGDEGELDLQSRNALLVLNAQTIAADHAIELANLLLLQAQQTIALNQTRPIFPPRNVFLTKDYLATRYSPDINTVRQEVGFSTRYKICGLAHDMFDAVSAPVLDFFASFDAKIQSHFGLPTLVEDPRRGEVSWDLLDNSLKRLTHMACVRISRLEERSDNPAKQLCPRGLKQIVDGEARRCKHYAWLCRERDIAGLGALLAIACSDEDAEADHAERVRAASAAVDADAEVAAAFDAAVAAAAEATKAGMESKPPKPKRDAVPFVLKNAVQCVLENRKNVSGARPGVLRNARSRIGFDLLWVLTEPPPEILNAFEDYAELFEFERLRGLIEDAAPWSAIVEWTESISAGGLCGVLVDAIERASDWKPSKNQIQTFYWREEAGSEEDGDTFPVPNYAHVAFDGHLVLLPADVLRSQRLGLDDAGLRTVLLTTTVFHLDQPDFQGTRFFRSGCLTPELAQLVANAHIQATWLARASLRDEMKYWSGAVEWMVSRELVREWRGTHFAPRLICAAAALRHYKLTQMASAVNSLRLQTGKMHEEFLHELADAGVDLPLLPNNRPWQGWVASMSELVELVLVGTLPLS